MNKPLPRIPSSTYRLQFNGKFTFADAERILPYLDALGITDIYSSPIFKARPGSTHGYDIVDHGKLNPELGGEDGFAGLAKALRGLQMGQVLDIVPNHMGVGSLNPWWMDLLENGPSSPYAAYFDIDWHPVKAEMKDKLLLPILGAQYGAVLENQEITLKCEGGAFFVSYYDHRLPIRPQSYRAVLTHRIDELSQFLGEADAAYKELLSIVTALGYLPPYTERDPDRRAERMRETEVIKRRLMALYNESSVVREHIDSNIAAFNGDKSDPASFDLLDRLMSEQAYRLSSWRVAAEEINYRRFFDVNELASLRVELQDVFEQTHALIFKLIEDGAATGLRVDHPDGLYDPKGYFEALQRSCYISRLKALGVDKEQAAVEFDKLISQEPHYKPSYIVGEKILIKGERMPDDWPIFSTTGYVFMNLLHGLFVNPDSAKAFDREYANFIKEKSSINEEVYRCKKLIMDAAMASEINTLAHYLNDLSEQNRHTRDFTLNSLRNALTEVIAFLPVYRTYINGAGTISEVDRKYVEYAVSKAKRNNPAMDESILDFLKRTLLLDLPPGLGDESKEYWKAFVMRFQQITGPVMAKGVEDTAFYRYNRFVSLNEVGGSPERFGVSMEMFHGQNLERAKNWPHALIATSTHDAKRGEDVRARLAVLSEMPGEWHRHVALWRKLNRRHKTKMEGVIFPDLNTEYLLYQTLVGAWPMSMDEGALIRFGERIWQYMLKASREAKVNTSWINPNAKYEEALSRFIEDILHKHDSAFLQDFVEFQRRVSFYGMLNSLSQVLLKITSPGVPDFYQGTELWDLWLVDPDNRLPVDYERRAAMLGEIKDMEQAVTRLELAWTLYKNMQDGTIKLYLIYKALNFRRASRDVFDATRYVPLEVRGARANCLCAFARIGQTGSCVVLAPRYFTELTMPERMPLGNAVWQDTQVVLPFEAGGWKLRNIFTDEEVSVTYDKLLVADALKSFPVALLSMEL